MILNKTEKVIDQVNLRTYTAQQSRNKIYLSSILIVVGLSLGVEMVTLYCNCIKNRITALVT